MSNLCRIFVRLVSTDLYIVGVTVSEYLRHVRRRVKYTSIDRVIRPACVVSANLIGPMVISFRPLSSLSGTSIVKTAPMYQSNPS